MKYSILLLSLGAALTQPAFAADPIFAGPAQTHRAT